jgi:hypothetical protein
MLTTTAGGHRPANATTVASSGADAVWSLSGHSAPLRAICSSRSWLVSAAGTETLVWVASQHTWTNRERLVHTEAPTHMDLSTDSAVAFHCFASGQANAIDLRTSTHLSTFKSGASIVNTIAPTHNRLT